MDLMNKTIEDTADEPFELLIVYSQVLISKKGEINYMQMWDSDYVDDFASTYHMDVLAMRLPLQAPIPSDTSSAGLHWAYYEKMLARFAALAVPDHQMYLGYQVQEPGSKHLADRHDHQSFNLQSHSNH